jgi:hypothetical protein
MSRKIPAEFYLELEPKIGQRWINGGYEEAVESVKVARTTVKKPDNVGRNNVVVKLKVYVPEHVFINAIAEATIVIPDDMIETVKVEAVVPEGE